MSKKDEEKKETPSPKLIPMVKAGEQIEVCKAQVAHHERLGWAVKK